MPADAGVNRAVVQAGTAADALQHLAVVAGQYLGAPVVQQHDMRLQRAVGIGLAPRPRVKTGVAGLGLAGGRAHQQAQHGGGVAGPGQHPVECGADDQHVGQVGAQVTVALVGYQHAVAVLGDQGIGADDADFRFQEMLTQHPPGLGHHVGGLGQIAFPQVVLGQEQLADFRG